MGIYPALQTSHADLVGGLKEGGRGTSGSAQQLRFRKILDRRAGRVLGHVARGRGVAHHQLRALESAKHRLSVPTISGRLRDFADRRAIPTTVRDNVSWNKLWPQLRNVPGLESATMSADIPLIPPVAAIPLCAGRG